MTLRAAAWLLAGAALATPAAAAEQEPWREVRDWTIKRDVAKGQCVLSTSYKGAGTTILLLINEPGTDTARLAVGNAGWDSLKPGDDPKLRLDMGPGREWSDLTTKSFRTDDYGFVLMTFSAKEFLPDFAAATKLHVFRGDTVVDRLAMNGSMEATLELIKCGNSINNGIAVDPFKP